MRRSYPAELVVVCAILVAAVGCAAETYGRVQVQETGAVEGLKAQTSEAASVGNEVISRFSDWFSRDFAGERELLNSVRGCLVDGGALAEAGPGNIGFDPSYSYTAVTLYQQGNKPLRHVCKEKTLYETLNRIIDRLREEKRFGDFAVGEGDKCRIMLEVVTGEEAVAIDKLSTCGLGANRFEPGITGLKFEYKGSAFVYMPTDAVTLSHLSVKHVLDFVSQKIGVAKSARQRSERIERIMEVGTKWSKITSVAFVTDGEDILPLYRGYPMPVEFSGEKMFEATKTCAKWICENMGPDGRFLYYYDPIKDSVIDHVHPNRTLEDNYYNILRHSGGIIALLKMYEATGDERFMTAAEDAFSFLIKQVREHSHEGRRAFYVFYNGKAKLGGTGIALVALMRYYQLTGDTRYNEYIFGMAQHIISRIREDGELTGYYIHPRFNDGRPILSPTEQQVGELFSFYYPGEALLGLALFEREMPLTDEYRREVKDAARRALDFLVKVRPVKYAEKFEPLPSDGWLMQAIELWADYEEFQRREYLDFVFNDAKAMISHMYTERDALYYDYAGTFYYGYGDHAYPDAARGEGLIAAYYLAAKTGEEELADFFLENCRTAARALMHTYNSRESTYMHRYPSKSIGSFRLKFTRQWVRVDMAQHAVCLLLRLLSATESQEQRLEIRTAGDKSSLSPAAHSYCAD